MVQDIAVILAIVITIVGGSSKIIFSYFKTSIQEESDKIIALLKGEVEKLNAEDVRLLDRIKNEAEASNKMDEKQDEKIEELRQADIQLRAQTRDTDINLYSQQLDLWKEHKHLKGKVEGGN